jgi:hypothetical protein
MTDSKVLPVLLFAGTAEKATNFYVSWFPGAKVENLVRYGANQPDKEGSVMTASFTLAGHEANPISPTCSDSIPSLRKGRTVVEQQFHQAPSRGRTRSSSKVAAKRPLGLIDRGFGRRVCLHGCFGCGAGRI